MLIIIPIEPVEQQRPRATNRGGHVQIYDPPKVKKFKKEVAEFINQQRLPKFENVELSVQIRFYRKVQKSLSKKERELRLSHIHRPVVKPDLDNYTKSILDALNGLLWDDDAKIVHLELDKYYSEEPRIEVEIEGGAKKNGKIRI